MRKHAVSMEAEGELNAQTSPEGSSADPGDAPGVLGADDDNPTDGEEPPLEAPKDGDPDPLPGATGTTPTDGDAPPPVDPDTPIELEDMSDLQVDRLKRLTDKQELKQLKRTETDATINKALDDVSILQAAVEQLRERVRTQTVSLEALSQATGTLGRVRRNQRYGTFVPPINRSSDYAAKLVLESFASTIRSLFRTIIAAIIRAIDWIKERFRAFFTENHWVQDSTKRITELVIAQRRTHAHIFKEALRTKAIDEDNYILDMPEAKMWLTYGDRQPGAGMVVSTYDSRTGQETGRYEPTYMDAFDDLFVIANMHEIYGSSDFIQWCKAVPDVIEAIQEQQKDYPEAAGQFQTWKRLLPRARPLRNFEGYECSEDCRMFVSEGYLGSTGIIVEMPWKLPDTTVRERIEQLAMWKIAFRKEVVSMKDAALRYLYDNEISLTSAKSEAICDELAKQRRTADIFTEQSNKLKSYLTAIESSFSDLTQSGEEGTEKAMQYTQLSHAIHAVVRNASVVLDASSLHCRKVQGAWLKYLSLTYKKDSELVRKMYRKIT